MSDVVFAVLFLLIAAGAGSGFFLLYRGLRERSALARRLGGSGGSILAERLGQRPARVAVMGEQAVSRGPRQTLLPGVQQFLLRTRARTLLAQLDLALSQARIPLKSTEFLYVAAASLFITLLLVQFTTSSVWLTLAVTLAAGFGPFYYLHIAQRMRLAKLDMQVADALLLISNSLRAGASFMDAMDVASREMPPPISEEFARTLGDVSLGVPVEEAFQRMCDRSRSEDLDLAVTAFKIQREVGGELAVILDNIGETIRDRARLRQEIRTLSAQGKLSGAILCALPVGLVLLLHLMYSDYIRVLVSEPQGRVMVFVALTMQALGVLLVSRIVRIDA
ncbi:MAG: type II secretion system F family protein [Armatimonadota bacterium]|nr:type II secretion system F family protein [Armatimonadota bacterium]